MGSSQGGNNTPQIVEQSDDFEGEYKRLVCQGPPAWMAAD